MQLACMARFLTLHATAFALVGAVLAQSAHAAPLGILAMPLAVTSVFSAVDTCPVGPVPALGLATTRLVSPGTSKASALLGGRVSQLDLMRQQQGLKAPAAATQVADFGSISALQPGAAAPPLGGRPMDCSAGLGFAVHAVQPALQSARVLGVSVLNPVLAAPGDFLASKRLPIRHTSFDRDWNRVRGSGLSRNAAKSAVPLAVGGPSAATLTAVNRWTNSSIHYAEDRKLYGEADHWATAGETLRLREGDCEDIAIVKMQLLAAYGVKRENMSLVIAHDLARGADHALLVVKLDGRMWLLDNSTDQVLDATQSYDYRPILSFSEGKKWIHGY